MQRRMPSSNTSVFDAVNESNQIFPQMDRNAFWYTTVILIIFIMILATLGNVMVLAATRMERTLHQPDKYFVACLASADLLVGIFSCPIKLWHHVHDADGSTHVCRLYFIFNVFTEAASINTLLLVSFDRYLKISRPLQYKLIMTTSKSLVMITIIWLISAAYVVFGMFSYKGSSGIYVSPYGCDTKNYVFVTFCAICGFFIPTIIILFIYACIFRIAHRRRKTTHKRQLGQTKQVDSQRSSLYKDIKNIHMMATVVGTFVVCWGPFFIFEILQMYNPKANEYIQKSTVAYVLASKILPKMNSICNPIIYACLDGKYREAFMRMLRRIMYR